MYAIYRQKVKCTHKEGNCVKQGCGFSDVPTDMYLEKEKKKNSFM